MLRAVLRSTGPAAGRCGRLAAHRRRCAHASKPRGAVSACCSWRWGCGTCVWSAHCRVACSAPSLPLTGKRAVPVVSCNRDSRRRGGDGVHRLIPAERTACPQTNKPAPSGSHPPPPPPLLKRTTHSFAGQYSIASSPYDHSGIIYGCLLPPTPTLQAQCTQNHHPTTLPPLLYQCAKARSGCWTLVASATARTASVRWTLMHPARLRAGPAPARGRKCTGSKT